MQHARAALVAATLAVAPAAHASIVNVQSILATEADQGLSGAVTGSFDWRTGSSRRLWMSLAPVARYRHGDHLIVALASGELLQTSGVSFDQRIFEHLRYRYTFIPRLVGEAFTQHEYNEQRRLLLRALVGAGPRVQLVDTDRTHIGLGVAYMLEYERLDENSMIDANHDELNHRISSYITGSYAVDDDMLVVGTAYAQPEIVDPGDVKMLVETQLVFKPTKHLSFSTAFTLFFDSEEPDGVEPLDTRLLSSFTVSF